MCACCGRLTDGGAADPLIHLRDGCYCLGCLSHLVEMCKRMVWWSHPIKPEYAKQILSEIPVAVPTWIDVMRERG